MAWKPNLFGLAVVLVLLVQAPFLNGLKTPKHHGHLEDVLKESENQKEDEVSFDLDDLHNWWDDSYEADDYSYEDYFDYNASASKEEPITIATSKEHHRNPHHKHHNNNHHNGTESVKKSEAETEASKAPARNLTTTSSSPIKSSTPAPKSSGKKEVKQSRAPAPASSSKDIEDFKWEDDEDDEDDGFMHERKDGVIGDLPSDKDTDAEKYFNPDRYHDKFVLHALEDILNREWSVNYEDTNLPCIMLRGNIKLVVPVNPTWFNKDSDFVEIEVPHFAKASGTCTTPNKDFQEIKLTWNTSIEGSSRSYDNSVYFAFASNWTSEFSDLTIPADKYALVAVTAVYYNGEINTHEGKKGDKGIASFSVNDLAEFITPRNQSMSCYKEKSIVLKEMQMTFSDLQLEAFRPNLETLTPGEFSTSVLCDVDETVYFDGVMTIVIYFWIGALLVVFTIFFLLLSMGYRRRRSQDDNGFGYKILSA